MDDFICRGAEPTIDSVTGIVYASRTLPVGTYNRTITVTDTTGAIATKAVRVIVNAAVSVTTGSNIATTYGFASQSSAFGRSGGTGAVTLSMTPINAGVSFTLTSESTSLVVTVDSSLAVGTYYETVVATDSLGETGTKIVVITVNETLTIISGSDIQTTQGVARSSTAFSSSNGTGTKTFSIVSVVDSSGATRSASVLGLTINFDHWRCNHWQFCRCRYLQRSHPSYRRRGRHLR